MTDTSDNPTDTHSLRYAINNPSVDQIQFDLPAGSIITLDSRNGPLEINRNLNITGPGAGSLTIDGGYTSDTTGVRVFTIGSNVTVAITDLTIADGNGYPSHQDGGGISNAGTLTLTNDTIRGSQADNAGGLYNTGQLTLNYSTVSGNYGINSCGGIWNSASGTLTLNYSTISGNGSAFAGAGIYNSGTLKMDNSTVSDNSNWAYGDGGGIYNSGIATVSNSTVSKNYGDRDGGGICNVASGNLTLNNSTVSGNQALVGGGIDNEVGGTAKVGNTIVAGNLASSGPDVGGAFSSLGYNLIGDGTGSTGFTNNINGDQVGTNDSPINPQLGPLQDNGGPTLTQALLPGSPAINTGDPNFNAYAFDPPLLNDQRGPGFARVVGGRIDVGAFEVQTGPYVVTSTADDGSTGTLRDAINQVNDGKYTGIEFGIAGTGVQTINLASALPVLTASGVFINGYSENLLQGATSASPLIELNGSGAGSTSDGLLLTGSNCIVSGLIIDNFGKNGIEVDGNGVTIGGTATGAGNVLSGNKSDGVLIDSGVSGVVVQGNYIGTDATGAKAVANSIGVDVEGPNNTIGGTAAAARNIISGNSTDGIFINASGVAVQGNYVGIDVTGTTAVANSIGVEVSVSGNVLGGTATGAGNVLSGNKSDGVLIDKSASGVQVQGNYIGADATGTTAVANSVGIEVRGSNSTIGGTAAAARNIISGNSADGVYILNNVFIATPTGVQVQGNFIGTDVAGAKAVANGIGVEVYGNPNTIGGTATGAGNVISGNSGDGVEIRGSSVTVQGNLIGTDATGTKSIGNNVGVWVSGTNTIGGTTSGARNIISGNKTYGVYASPFGSSGFQVQGNYIGTDVTGTKALGNAYGIYSQSWNDTIGGTSAAARNVISGNTDGIFLDSNGPQTVQGNYIGTDVTGTKAVANSIGIIVNVGDTIGGTAAGAGNVISGNTTDGVRLSSSGVTVQGNYIGTNAAGSAALGNSVGIEVAASNNTIGALNVISGNTKDGVLIDSKVSGVQVQGNYIGTNPTGTAAVANNIGVEIAGNSNTIGGASGSRNLISGNTGDGVLIDSGASGNQVLGNYIGTKISGTTALGNSIGMEVAGNNNTLGASYAVGPNVISGNTGDGVLLDSSASGNQVLGNYIGTNYAGTAAVANKVGIEDAGSSNTIGGSVLGARNIISGNTGNGVLLDSTSTAENMWGNYIGLNVGGNTALANGSNGIEVQGTGNTIGGNSGANYFTRNFISGNSKDGVLIDIGASSNLVLGNFIGIGVSGTQGVGNLNGVEIDGSSNTIGSTASGNTNFISGNTNDGVLLDTFGAGNLIQGTDVGTDYTGQHALANGMGIVVLGTRNTLGGTTSGARNIISGNSRDGVRTGDSANGNQVLGNFLGLNASAAALGNGGNGVSIAGNNNTIGGSVSGSRNIISGNSYGGVYIISNLSSGNQVLGNYIGTNINGNAALANGGDGVEVAGTGNTVGGTASAARNIISGNSYGGVALLPSASGNQVLGNYIGTDVTGSKAIANIFGIIDSGTTNTIGGSVAGARNVISGNSYDGVQLTSSARAETVQSNIIGLNAAGTAALANSVNGLEIAGNNNTIGGASGVNNYTRNFLSGNTYDGLLIDSGASGNVVLGNAIGVNTYDSAALGNSGNGIEVDGNSNTIGASYAVAPNEISGNSNDGVLLASGSSANQVLGNYIGTNHAGLIAVANKVGIEDAGSSNSIGGSVLGARNVISGNSGDGVLLDSTATAENMWGNYIGLNVGGNTILANGDNGVEVQGTGNTIGGNSGTNYFTRNFISGNSGDGVRINSGASGNQVLGNFIGIGVSGTNGVGNVGNAIEIAGSSNTIGGTVSGYRNVISGSGNDGVLIGSTGANNLIQGNFVGTEYTGRTAVANSGNGIDIQGTGNTVGGTVSGAGNVISGNSKDGVLLSTGSGNTISRNSIFANAGLGISLASGANNNIAAPTLNSVTLSGSTLTVTGNFTAPAADGSYVLEFFANLSGDAEGKIYLGSLTVTPTSTGTQLFTFSRTTTVTGTYPLITATLTDATGDTSAFSSDFTVQ